MYEMITDTAKSQISKEDFIKRNENIYSGIDMANLDIQITNVEEGKVFEAGEVKIWKCRNCGHIVVGTKAPEVCPVCSHPKAFFEIKAENY